MKNNRHGILYGVGVGPGDPELMTVKAVNVIKRCDVIALPAASRHKAVSYQIALQMVPEIKDKPSIELGTPMTKDRKVLTKAYDNAAESIAYYLEKGMSVAYLTIGDPTVYSTYIYMGRRIEKMGYETQIISGVPSFCAAAAKTGDSLADRKTQIHIIPSSYDIEKTLEMPGTKVMMKAGSKLREVKTQLQNYIAKQDKTDSEQCETAQQNETSSKQCNTSQQNNADSKQCETVQPNNADSKQCETAKSNDAENKLPQCYMIENCGMPDEKIYRNIDEMPDEAGYYSIIVLKDMDFLR